MVFNSLINQRIIQKYYVIGFLKIQQNRMKPFLEKKVTNGFFVNQKILYLISREFLNGKPDWMEELIIIQIAKTIKS